MPLVVVPQSTSGYVGHAVTIAKGMLYDSTLESPMVFNRESLDWLCHNTGGVERHYLSIMVTVRNEFQVNRLLEKQAQQLEDGDKKPAAKP